MSGPNQAFRPTSSPHLSLRRLLSRRGSYPLIVAAAGSGPLPHFPVTLFEHVGHVYRRVEAATDHNLAGLEELRLAALVHEEPQESLAKLLDSAGVSDFEPTVVALTGVSGQSDSQEQRHQTCDCSGRLRTADEPPGRYPCKGR